MRRWPERHRKAARIEIIPMIDVMMFLLVFFVLISINVLPSLGLKISAPFSGRPDKIVEKIKIIVGIDKDGATYIDGSPVSVADLPNRIHALSDGKPTNVVIAGDEGANVQALVSVLDALKIAGVAGAQIVTKAHARSAQ